MPQLKSLVELRILFVPMSCLVCDYLLVIKVVQEGLPIGPKELECEFTVSRRIDDTLYYPDTTQGAPQS